MFEKLAVRAARKAELRAKERLMELNERIGADLPQGVRAEATGEGVVLSGRGLKQRFVMEAALRWMRLS